MTEFVFQDPAEAPHQAWWDCKISVPVGGQNGPEGERETQIIPVLFQALSPEDEAAALSAGGVVDVIVRAAQDWRVRAPDGSAVPVQRIRDAMASPWVRDGLWRAYNDFTGRTAETR